MDDLERKRSYLVEAAQSRHPDILSFFRRLRLDADTAEDLAQETFLIAWQRASRLHGQRVLRSWLYGIAYRLYLQHRERAAAETAAELTEELVASTADPGSDQRLSAKTVRDAVLTLPDAYRYPLVLVYWQDLSYLEAARVLSLPVGTLGWRVHRALKLMRQALAGKGFVDDLSSQEAQSARTTDPFGQG